MMSQHLEVVSMDDEEGMAELEILPNQGQLYSANSDTNTITNSDDNEDEDQGMDSLIRIRKQDDEIFETEMDDDDDEDDEFCDGFPHPEVLLGSSSPPTSRKRKQEVSFRSFGDDSDEMLLELDYEPKYVEGDEESHFPHSDIFKVRRSDRMPLYKLDPQDYAHDPRKQLQIRRAIITFRHHQLKKAQIIKLTQESTLLREQVATLKAKVCELASCGCPENQVANLEVLSVEVPVVPPKMYVRGKRTYLAAPFNKGHYYPFDVKSTGHGEPRIDSIPTPYVPDVPKPLMKMNIATSRLQQISSTSPSPLSSVKVAETPSQPPRYTRVIINRNRIIASQGERPNRLANYFRNGPNVGDDVPGGPGKSALKTSSQNVSKSDNISNQSNGTAPSSRIVFVKSSANNSREPLTASQLLFALKRQAVADAGMNGQATSHPQQPSVSTPVTPALPTSHNNNDMPLLTPAPSVANLLKAASGHWLRVVRNKDGHTMTTASGQVSKVPKIAVGETTASDQGQASKIPKMSVGQTRTSGQGQASKIPKMSVGQKKTSGQARQIFKTPVSISVGQTYVTAQGIRFKVLQTPLDQQRNKIRPPSRLRQLILPKPAPILNEHASNNQTPTPVAIKEKETLKNLWTTPGDKNDAEGEIAPMQLHRTGQSSVVRGFRLLRPSNGNKQTTEKENSFEESTNPGNDKIPCLTEPVIEWSKYSDIKVEEAN